MIVIVIASGICACAREAGYGDLLFIHANQLKGRLLRPFRKCRFTFPAGSGLAVTDTPTIDHSQ
ncbi:MAG TPA: hypothetical protein PLH64_05535 [Anaerolineaceae bacterium]|jgi:hypothetical protein|nr:hypothetical protein [Anaerolineaceae bacterium]